MNVIHGKPATFESKWNKQDEKFYQRVEQLHFPKALKEHTFILRKPVTPIFKPKPEKKKTPTPPESTLVSSAPEDVQTDEYGTEYGEMGPEDYFSEYETEEEDALKQEFSTLTSEPTVASLPPPNYGPPPSLVNLCVRHYAENFETAWKYIKNIPETNLRLLSKLLDLDKIEIGQAATAILIGNVQLLGMPLFRLTVMVSHHSDIDDDYFWKRLTKRRWVGYHKPWAHSQNWKIYFLQKYLAECISSEDPNECDMRKLCRLARRMRHWVYMLDIKELSAPLWPAAVDVDSSVDTGDDTCSDRDILSVMTLDDYLNRNTNFFPMPNKTDRLPLRPIFETLEHLTHLHFSFGFSNFSLNKDLKFSCVTDIDALNLAQALKVCASLYCFKLSRSKITPEQLETILLGLKGLDHLRETEFSHVFLNDDHLIPLTAFLYKKPKLKIMCLKCNAIGHEGFIRLLHVVILKSCQLKVLDVSMNPIGDVGGVAMAALLSKKMRFLKKVFMSGTNLTYVSGYNIGVVLYFNKTLLEIDLSANDFNDFAAEALMKGVEHNYTLRRVDLRECGIPFPTVREIERICYQNSEKNRRQQYVYPVVTPTDFWSGFKSLDAQPPEELRTYSSPEKMVEEEEITTQELTRIFVWATAMMKPRNRCLLVRDLYNFMKKSSFVTGVDVILDSLMLTKQRELIQRAKADAKREKDERGEGSSQTLDFSIVESSKQSMLKLKVDFLELEALQMLKEVNRCGRIDELFKSVKPDRIDGILKKISKTLETDQEIISTLEMSLPFARKRYLGFPDPMELDEVEDEEVSGELEAIAEQSEIKGELEEEFGEEETLYTISEASENTHSVTAMIPSTLSRKSVPISETISTKLPSPTVPLPSAAPSSTVQRKSEAAKAASRNQSGGIAIVPTLPVRSKSTAFGSGQFDNILLEARNKLLGIREKCGKWPKDGPPEFPRVIPHELITNCNDEFSDTENEREDDFPYWLSEWLQKY